MPVQVDVSLEIQKYVFEIVLLYAITARNEDTIPLNKAWFLSIVASDISDFFFLQKYLLKSIISCHFHSILLYIRCQQDFHLSIFDKNRNKHIHVRMFTF